MTLSRISTRLLNIGVAALCGALHAAVSAAPIAIPNGSFEAPVIRTSPFATNVVQSWEKAPMPDGWLLLGLTEEDWLNTAGVFWNAPGAAHIENGDGEQAAFLFSTPGVELFQLLPAVYEPGFSYRLRVGVQGGGNGMAVGTPLELRLYYLDDEPLPGGNWDHRLTLASVTALNITDESDPLHEKRLVDWEVLLPTVGVEDPWAGKNIGVQIIANVTAEQSGFWRVDNVRLEAIPEPAAALLLGAGGLTLLAGRRRRRTHVAPPPDLR